MAANNVPKSPFPKYYGCRDTMIRYDMRGISCTKLQDLPDLLLEQIFAKIDGRALRSILLTGNKRLQYFARCRYNQVCWLVHDSWWQWYRPAVENKTTEELQHIQNHRHSEQVRVVRQMGLRLDHSADRCDENLFLHFAPIARTFAQSSDNIQPWLTFVEEICCQSASESYQLDEYMDAILGLLGFIAEVAFPPPLTAVPAWPADLLALDQLDVAVDNGRCFDLAAVTNAFARPEQIAVIDEWMAQYRIPDLSVSRWVRDMYVRTCLLQSAVAQCESLCVRHIGDRRLFTEMLPMFRQLRRLWVYQLGETDLPWVVEYLQEPVCRVVDVTLNACMPEYVRHRQLVREWVRFPPDCGRVESALRSAGRIGRRMERVRLVNYHYLTDRMVRELRTRFDHWPDFEFENSRWMNEQGVWVRRVGREMAVPSVPEMLGSQQQDDAKLWPLVLAIRGVWMWIVRTR